uniref:Uncharacterized protein n=1 Tax=Arundo donax TaxID=35708 RepID=A0A0A9DPK7_ARUDO
MPVASSVGRPALLLARHWFLWEKSDKDELNVKTDSSQWSYVHAISVKPAAIAAASPRSYWTILCLWLAVYSWTINSK